MSVNLVILYSGGADSRLMLDLAQKTGKYPFCVLIDYGQLHIEELDFAKKQLDDFEIKYQVVSIKDLGINSGLTGDGNKNETGEVHEMYVPSRNLMFIGIAASIAESKGIDLIWFGADWSDYLNGFPDCKQEWVGRINKMLEINGPKPIMLEAPLIGMSKEMILKLLEEFGIKQEEVFSGYGDL